MNLNDVIGNISKKRIDFTTSCYITKPATKPYTRNKASVHMLKMFQYNQMFYGTALYDLFVTINTICGTL